ncbi:hypothetical protein [Streptomyces sp. VRA16 Mangrove soil]|uniref:hypothetical protein n=1 Tax=Streptomyces sp. VRA16 Mangrove soil TaxID=2817434 RepID=UPI001A9F8138|nr:hypothetical protein [Streptomyces sp. VRA16 Mangrove soil]MBO1337942.1 hypothetical protein [Streptomyces sp. VRA16 Mangrove soil]
MSTDLNGVIECRPGARLWGPDDEDSLWHAAVDLWLLDVGNAYDALSCLFGVRNTYGWRPLAEGRGLPADASETLTADHGADDPYDAGTTWITWAELLCVDWQETDASGVRTRAQVAGDGTHWGPAWDIMRTLGDLHGPANVRLVVWFG